MGKDFLYRLVKLLQSRLAPHRSRQLQSLQQPNRRFVHQCLVLPVLRIRAVRIRRRPRALQGQAPQPTHDNSPCGEVRALQALRLAGQRDLGREEQLLSLVKQSIAGLLPVSPFRNPAGVYQHLRKSGLHRGQVLVSLSQHPRQQLQASAEIPLSLLEIVAGDVGVFDAAALGPPKNPRGRGGLGQPATSLAAHVELGRATVGIQVPEQQALGMGQQVALNELDRGVAATDRLGEAVEKGLHPAQLQVGSGEVQANRQGVILQLRSSIPDLHRNLQGPRLLRAVMPSHGPDNLQVHQLRPGRSPQGVIGLLPELLRDGLDHGAAHL
mmetsp:Transcript_67264/g.179355  ORF Transcript_67264/g.179355 Transcript_67264/m.179355 type:complete len:326 (+) Transcript_67264:209-1186(+)